MSWKAMQAADGCSLLSYDTWRRHFNANPGILGTAVEFRSGALLAPFPPRLQTVVGVLPSDFEFPTGPLDFYTPIVLDAAKRSPQVTMICRVAVAIVATCLPAARASRVDR